MGGDGGSIPRREELVRKKKEPERVNTSEVNAARWKYCAITQDRLREPVVACKLGRLYNKEAIIEHLLTKKPLPSHIKKLKDVRELRFSKAKFTHQSSTSVDPKVIEAFSCPIMNFELDGQHEAVTLWSCGCVYSKKAMDSVKSKNCLICEKDFEPNDVILLNPTKEEDIQNAQARVEAVKSRKRVAKDITTDSTTSVSNSSASKNQSSEPIKSSGVCSTSSEPVEKEAVSTSKKSKMNENNSTKKFPDKAKKSEVYKSLFTSSEEAKKQPKGHWVTYCPLYF